MANERTANSKSVFAEIAERLNSLTPGQYICPAVEQRDDVTIVGTANDDVRRMATLCSMLVDEHNELAREGLRLQNMVQQAVRPNGHYGPMAVFRSLFSNLSLDTVNRLDEVLTDLTVKNDLAQVAKDLLWLEVRRQFPQVIHKPVIGIFDGWQVGWSNKSEQTRIQRLFGGEDGDMPEELTSFIEGLLRRRAA